MSGTMIEGHSGPAPATTRERVVHDASVRQAALVAGWAILAMAALSAFGIFYVVDGLVTRGEAATTVEDIAASTGLFRWGTASLYAVVVLDVVVAWALFRFFRPVSSGLSRLAAWFRLAYAGVFMIAIGRARRHPGPGVLGRIFGSSHHRTDPGPDPAEDRCLR